MTTLELYWTKKVSAILLKSVLYQYQHELSLSSSPYLVCCACLLCVGVAVSYVSGPCAIIVSAVENPRTGLQMPLLGLADQDEDAVVGLGYVD